MTKVIKFSRYDYPNQISDLIAYLWVDGTLIHRVSLMEGATWNVTLMEDRRKSDFINMTTAIGRVRVEQKTTVYDLTDRCSCEPYQLEQVGCDCGAQQ